MAQPSSRQGLIDYAKRQLGFPVLEINVADEQFSDLLDDAVQVYQERHYDGITRMYLKYKITQDDIDRGQARGGDTTLGRDLFVGNNISASGNISGIINGGTF